MITRTEAPGAVILPVVWCLAAAALFGLSTPAAKHLLDGQVGPLTLAGLLYLGAGLATAPFARTGGSSRRRRDAANVRRLLGAVIFGGVVGPVALLVGLRMAPAASVSLWLNLETTFTAVLAWAFFREHLDRRGWAANALVLIAGALLAASDGFALVPAALLIALACLCWGLDNNLTATIDGYTPAQTTTAKGFVAGAVNLALGVCLEGRWPGAATVAAALGVGALAYGASIVLYIRGAQQLGASRSQMIFATAPFLGALGAWLALGEPVVGGQVAAGLLLALALGLLLTSRHEHAHAHASTRHTHAHRHGEGHHTHPHPGLATDAWHTHEHDHEPVVHRHPHVPDLHHRHEHER